MPAEGRELGQAGTPAFSNFTYGRGKDINREKGDAAALASYFLLTIEEQPSYLLNKLIFIKIS